MDSRKQSQDTHIRKQRFICHCRGSTVLKAVSLLFAKNSKVSKLRGNVRVEPEDD
jgi:hypothetical protein